MNRLRRHDEGMMILLGAILLVAAFLALAVVLSKVQGTHDAVPRELDDRLVPEARDVAQGVESVARTVASSASYCADLRSALDSIAESVSRDGYLMWWTLDACTDAASRVTVTFGLDDGASKVQQTVTVR